MSTCSKCKVREVELESQKTWCKECRLEARKQAIAFRNTHPRKKYGGMSYQSRDLHLSEIGFKSYAEYLNSDLWSKVRTKVFFKKGRRCYLCGNYASQVHHQRYHKNDLMGDCLNFLHPICPDCHKTVEFSKKGKKVKMTTARGRFMERERRTNAHFIGLLANYDAEGAV